MPRQDSAHFRLYSQESEIRGRRENRDKKEKKEVIKNYGEGEKEDLKRRMVF